MTKQHFVPTGHEGVLYVVKKLKMIKFESAPVA